MKPSSQTFVAASLRCLTTAVDELKNCSQSELEAPLRSIIHAVERLALAINKTLPQPASIAPQCAAPDNEEESWQHVFNDIKRQATDHGIADIDVFVAWRIGLTAFKTAKACGARFPHQN